MSDSEKNANCNEKIIAKIKNVENHKTGTGEKVSEAPTGLLAEFLSSVMLKDYQTAFKHCAQILTYEPNNATARDFYPLILDKLEMISNEEYERTSSDSSESYTTDSKSSGNSLNQVGSHSSDDGRRFSSGDESYASIEKNGESLSANIDAEEKQIKSENMDATESESYFTPPRERSLKTLQSDENSRIKQNSKEELQVKTVDSVAQLSPKLLIHPTKTQILRYSSTVSEEKKKQNKSKKQKQKDQETPTVSQNQASSKILLYPTRTITYTKISTDSKLKKTENSHQNTN